MQLWIRGCERRVRRVLERDCAVKAPVERGRVGVSRMRMVRFAVVAREESAVVIVELRVERLGSIR